MQTIHSIVAIRVNLIPLFLLLFFFVSTKVVGEVLFDGQEHYQNQQQQQQPQQQNYDVGQEKKEEANQLPHILFIIMDDLGSHDLGIHGSGIHTPTINELITGIRDNSGDTKCSNEGGGIYLSNYYVLPYCSPTRAAILSGRYPLHTGVHKVIKPQSTQGLPLDEETLPQILRKAGYVTHAVGKWHVGNSNWEQTPTYRGFQSFYGFYGGGEDYYTHKRDGGLDYRLDKHEFCGPNCSQLINDDIYSTYTFTKEAVKIIQNYNMTTTTTTNSNATRNNNQNEPTQQPLFLYLAYQAVHAPDEVPYEYEKRYENHSSFDKKRKTYAGMLSCADEGIHNVTQALKEKGIWDNTLIIFTTDNGGPTDVCAIQGSSNYPLRGGKCTIYEGGTRGDAFLSGPALQNYRRMFHKNADCYDSYRNNGLPSNNGNDFSMYDEEKATLARKLNDNRDNITSNQGGATSGLVDHHNIGSSHCASQDHTASRSTEDYRHRNQTIYKYLSYPHIFHAVDWLPTIASMVQVPTNGKPLDGVDQFNAMLVNTAQTTTAIKYNKMQPDAATVTTRTERKRKTLKQEHHQQPTNTYNINLHSSSPPREEVFIGYAYYDHTGIGPSYPSWYGPALRYKNWKLIQGKSGGPESSTHIPDEGNPYIPAPGGIANSTYSLYNLKIDKEERYNVLHKYPYIAQLLQNKLRQYYKTFVPQQPEIDCPNTKNKFPGLTNTTEFGLVWIPWCNNSSKIIIYS